MKKEVFLILAALVTLLSGSCSQGKEENRAEADAAEHFFALNDADFVLDGSPFQIISGEIHYSRIPREYWRHRIQMVKAMGCNTVATYVFWNHHEVKPGEFDFTSGNRNIAEFLRIAKEEGMWCCSGRGPIPAESGTWEAFLLTCFPYLILNCAVWMTGI